MASSDIYKEIDKINKRALRVAAKWGQGSDVYKQYVTKIDRLVPASAVRTNKSGVIQISKSRDAQKAIKPDALATVRATTKTSSQYTQKVTKEYIREYGEGKPSTEQLQEFVSIKSAVKEAAQNGKLKIAYNKKGEGAASVMSKSEKTYEELWNILQGVDDTTDEDNEMAEAYLQEAFNALPDVHEKTPFD